MGLKLVDQESVCHRFGDLDLGAVFTVRGLTSSVLMKCRSLGNDYAVNLATAYIINMSSETPVAHVPKGTTLVVE